MESEMIEIELLEPRGELPSWLWDRPEDAPDFHMVPCPVQFEAPRHVVRKLFQDTRSAKKNDVRGIRPDGTAFIFYGFL